MRDDQKSSLSPLAPFMAISFVPARAGKMLQIIVAHAWKWLCTVCVASGVPQALACPTLEQICC
eukprot:5578602-Amphidinium_carterae.1